jgi:predicted small secreted protein
MDAEEEVEQESLFGIISLIRAGCNIPNSIKGAHLDAQSTGKKISNKIVQIFDI